MRILFIGDIEGSPGRRMVEQHLPRLQQEKRIDFTIANGENAAGGFGLNRKCYQELHNIGVDAFTLGNHVWSNKELATFIDQETRIVRPANLSARPLPGRGAALFEVGGVELLVINLIGRTYMQPAECPFAAVEALLAEYQDRTPFIFVDFHAEATSEKMALGWFLDGRVSALVGTHTHTQTNDARVLPRGTGFLTDAGMTGPRDSVLGVEAEIIVRKFLTGMPARFEIAHGDLQFNGVIYDLDDAGRCRDLELVNFWQPAL